MEDREKGLKLQLYGTGTGPQVKFTKAELDFGDVVVYTEKMLDVEIVNTVSYLSKISPMYRLETRK